MVGAILHRIQHFDQLSGDPEEGELSLFSLRVIRDEQARNTLPDIVDRATAQNKASGDTLAYVEAKNPSQSTKVAGAKPLVAAAWTPSTSGSVICRN